VSVNNDEEEDPSSDQDNVYNHRSESPPPSSSLPMNLPQRQSRDVDLPFYKSMMTVERTKLARMSLQVLERY
jgi:hypothetical protein